MLGRLTQHATIAVYGVKWLGTCSGWALLQTIRLRSVGSVWNTGRELVGLEGDDRKGSRGGAPDIRLAKFAHAGLSGLWRAKWSRDVDGYTQRRRMTWIELNSLSQSSRGTLHPIGLGSVRAREHVISACWRWGFDVCVGLASWQSLNGALPQSERIFCASYSPL